METITIPKEEFKEMKKELRIFKKSKNYNRVIEIEQLKKEIETLRNRKLYMRLLEFEKNISEGKVFTRKDLGF